MKNEGSNIQYLNNPDGQLENNQAKFEIVELTPNDWQKLQDLKLRSLDQEPIAFEDQETGKSRYLTRPEEEWRKILSGKLLDKEGEYINIFAKAKNQIVGMVGAVVPEQQDQNDKIATVHHMYVDKTWRGQAIGKELLQTLIGKLRQQEDVKKIELNVVATQVPAFEMYKSLGFKETARSTAKRGQNEYEEIKMELILHKKDKI